MNLLELIADALENPVGAFERLQNMGVQQQVIDHILALSRDDVEAETHRLGCWTTIAFRHDLQEK